MNKTLLFILFLILKQSWSDVQEIPEGFFLYNYFSEKKSTGMKTEASISHLIVNADFDSTFVLDNSLSYSGYVSVPFDKLLPLEEKHSLYFKRYGEHVSAGIKGEFAFSKQEYKFTEAQSNFRPDEYDYDYYIKSRTVYDNHSVFRYGGSINTGLNWSNKTLQFLAGGFLIKNTGYTVINDRDYYNENLQLSIIDFDNKDNSYSINGGALLSGKDFVLLKKYIYYIAGIAEYTKMSTPVHESQSMLELDSSSITYHGAKSRTQYLNLNLGFIHPSAIESAHPEEFKSKRPISFIVNSLQMQMYYSSDKTSDYYLHNDSSNVIEQKHTRELKGISCIIVPQITILDNYKLQLKTGVAKNDHVFPATTSIFAACIMSLSFPFRNGSVLTTTINSGDFLLRIMRVFNKENVTYPVYHAYSSSIALQLRM